METTQAPEEPAWKTKLKSLTPTKRQMLAIVLGVSDRTLQNWASGKHKPRDYAAQRIIKWKGGV